MTGLYFSWHCVKSNYFQCNLLKASFPGGPVVRTQLSLGRAWVQSLVGEIPQAM